MFPKIFHLLKNSEFCLPLFILTLNFLDYSSFMVILIFGKGNFLLIINIDFFPASLGFSQILSIA